MIKFVGFDKDGTLFDSISAYAKASGEIFHSWYPEISVAEGSKFFIETVGQESAIQVETILKKHGIILTSEEIFKKSNEWATKLDSKSKAKPFPEVIEALGKLKLKGFKLFVSSFQQEEVVKKDLLESDLMQFIDFYAGIRPEDKDYIKGLPHFSAAAKYFKQPFDRFVKETIFIGDTPTDIIAAKSVGMISVIRASKTFEGKFKNLGADYVIENFSGLLKLIN